MRRHEVASASVALLKALAAALREASPGTEREAVLRAYAPMVNVQLQRLNQLLEVFE